MSKWLRRLTHDETANRLTLRTIFVLTAVFYLPATVGGYILDDHFHLLVLTDLVSAFEKDWNLFSFVHSPAEVRILREAGVTTWWMSDDFRLDFYRPVASLTHWLDFRLFGEDPVAAHFTSIAWLVASVVLVHRVLSRFIAPRSPALLLSVAVFAFDDSHALNVHWLANRSDVVGGVFCLAAFIGWLRLREGARFGHLLLFGGFVAALLSKESSVVFPAVVLAHELILPDRPTSAVLEQLRPRVWVHAALFGLVTAYVVAYFALGHGPRTLYYLNPLETPLRWIGQYFRSALFNAVILATGVPLHVLSPSPVREQPVAFAASVTVMLSFCGLVWKFLRADRQAWFFVAWILIAQGIIASAYPDSRLLFLPSIAFAYLVARVAQEAFRHRDTWRPARVALAGVLGLHLVAAPGLAQGSLYVANSFQAGYATLKKGIRDHVDLDHLPAEGTEVLFLNWHQREAVALVNLYLIRSLPNGTDLRPYLTRPGWSYAEKLEHGLSALKVHYHALSFLPNEIEVRVVDDHQLEIAPKSGTFFPTLFEQVYMTSTRFSVGQQIKLRAYTATITETNGAGEVLRVRFTFPARLSSSRYVFLAFDGDRWTKLDLGGSVGRTLKLQALR